MEYIRQVVGNINQYQMDMQQLSGSLPFITLSPQGYQLHPHTLNILSQLPHSHCSVLAITGKAKTGKSYLLNRLAKLLQPSLPPQPFPVFDGIGAGTNGVRILPIVVDDHMILVLDMEGLGSLSSSSSNEGKLFALTLLLSSVIIYNNVGPLDLQALQGLGILAQIGKLVESSLSNSSKKSWQSPSLVVALRDFALSLETTSGQSITPKQYLQDALEEQRGTSTVITGKNQIKKTLKDVFASRDCFTLSLPSQNIPIQCSSPMREEFTLESSLLATAVKDELIIRPKEINGQEVSASEWLQFAKDLVEVVNSTSKGVNFKLEGLLLQAYRRQQGSVRERFAMMAETMLRKAEFKCHQVVSMMDLLSELDQIELGESVERGKSEVQKFEWQLKKAYECSCEEMEGLMRAQGGGDLGQVKIDYNNPGLSKIKDFEDLYSLKKEKEKQLFQLKDKLSGLGKQRFSKQEQSKMHKRDNQKFSLAIEEVGLAKDQKEADQKYFSFMKNLKEQGTSLDPQTLEANLLKMEVIYLRRKLECRSRVEVHQSVRSALKEQTNQKQWTQKKQVIEGKLYTFQSKEVTPFVTDPHSAQKSFLVPYLDLQQDQIDLQILRTIIKQDSRGNSYFQYMMEVLIFGRKWTFSRRWKDFNQLHNILIHLFPADQLPPFVTTNLAGEQKYLGKQQIEMRRDRLQRYIKELLSVPQVRNSRIMQKFLKINKEYVPFL